VKTVIFACIHNAGRSQMAAAFFNRIADATRARAVSAGTQPAERVHATVVEVMCEVGFDLGSVKPRLLTSEMAGGADLLVTMGCGETCPNVPGLRRMDWALRDPKGLPLDDVRSIREDVRDLVQGLVKAQGWAAPPARSE